MKRKFLTTLVLFASLAITACAGGNSAEQSQAPAESSTAQVSKCKTHKWAADPSKEDVPATCAQEGKTYQKCTVCGETQEKTVSKKDHTWVDDPANPSVEANCAHAGSENKKCSVCGETKSTPLPQTGHTFVDDGAAVGVVHKEIDNGCNTHAYRFEVSEATGWNKADTKMNGKSAPDNQSAWALGGAVPAGQYKVFISTRMSYQSHEDRYFYNQWETDTASQPDKESESPYRYYYQVDDGEFAYPMTTKSWGELNMKGGDGAEFTTVDVEATVTIAAGSTEFHLIHGNIGYSLVIAYVRLVEIKA